MPPIVWVGGIVSLSGTLFYLRIEAIVAVLRRRAAVHFPSGNGPPPCMRHRLTADECPHWDSNPEHKDFKSSVSANWTMGARLAKTEHKTPLFHESRVTHIRSSVPNNPRRSRLIREGADKAAKQPPLGNTVNTAKGGAEDRSPRRRPFHVQGLSGLTGYRTARFRALPCAVRERYRLLPGMPGAGSAGGESRRCRGRRSGSVPRWS